jgi:hypothetical protein
MIIERTITRMKIKTEKRVTSVPESVNKGFELISAIFLTTLSKVKIHLLSKSSKKGAKKGDRFIFYTLSPGPK